MADKYRVLDFVYDVLKTADKPLLYQEIWEAGQDKPFRNKLSLKGKTPWQTLGARVFVDIRDNPDSTLFRKVGKNPARFWLRERAKELPVDILEKLSKDETKAEKESKAKYTERELHPLLAYFAYTNIEFNRDKPIITKTIFHEKSTKKGLNEWVHPDMVGFYLPIDDWNSKLLEFSKISDFNGIKLYSFELKKKLNRSNYREYFFQAVSNSSWANESYLVAADISFVEEFLGELERLSNSFGIGIIHLDLEDIDASKILFGATTKDQLDWPLMNKLCDQNPDFEKFIDDVRKDYEVKTIHKSEYDDVLKDTEEYITKLLK